MEPSSPAQKYDLLYVFFCFFSRPITAKGDFMVSRMCPILTLLFVVKHFGPFRNTIKSTEAATGIEEIKNAWC